MRGLTTIAVAVFAAVAVVLGLVGTVAFLTAEAARPGRHYE